MERDPTAVSHAATLRVAEMAGSADTAECAASPELDASGWHDAAPVRAAVAAVRGGELVAYPTDTVYGLAADPRQPDAVKRVFRAKQRTTDLAIPLIAADTAQVTMVGRLSTVGRALASEFWPGPLALVIDAHPTVDRSLLGGRHTVAVRVPRSRIARGLAHGLGYPVTATSANRSGAPVCRTAQEIITMLGPELALVLDAGRSSDTRPSTIVDVSHGKPVLIREGVVPWDRVLQSLA